MLKLLKGELVRGLLDIVYKNDSFCDVCQKGKQHRTTFKSMLEVTTS